MLEHYKYTDTEIEKILKAMVILVDTREKHCENITSYFDKHHIPYKNMALPAGDFSFIIPELPEYGIDREKYFYNDIFIERKNSAEELAGCFSQTRNRFESEFASSPAKYKYLMVENCDYKKIVDGDYESEYKSGSFTASLHSFNTRYNLQLVFMPDVSYSPIFIAGTFRYYLRNLLKY